jgi:hypothetical protein
MGAALRDSVHWTAATYGESGKRYARTILRLMGNVSTYPKWFATAAERVSTTTTRITVVHSMGSDFTPTSGITGFEVSNNNGSSWASATGARESATTIILTHADLGTLARKVRYQFGKLCDVTAPVKDNGSLAASLNYTVDELTAAGDALLPLLTYQSSVAASSSGAVQTHASGIAITGGSEALLAVIGVTMMSNSASVSASVTAQPSGTVIAATLVEAYTSGSNNPHASIHQAQLPVGTTSITVTITYGANPFVASRFHVSTIPVASLSSTTKVGSGSARTAAALASSTSIATSSGGAIFILGANESVTGGNTGTFTGDETYTSRNNLVVAGGTHTVGDASNTAADATSAATVTYGNAANTTIAAAAWR